MEVNLPISLLWQWKERDEFHHSAGPGPVLAAVWLVMYNLFPVLAVWLFSIFKVSKFYSVSASRIILTLNIVTACPTCSLFLVACLPVADRWEIVGNRAGERPRHPVCLCYCRTEETGNTHSHDAVRASFIRSQLFTREETGSHPRMKAQDSFLNSSRIWEKTQTQHEWKG